MEIFDFVSNAICFVTIFQAIFSQTTSVIDMKLGSHNVYHVRMFWECHKTMRYHYFLLTSLLTPHDECLGCPTEYRYPSERYCS